MTDRNLELVSDGLMRVAEAADFLRVSRSSVYELMAGGELPWARLGRSRRIPRRAVVALAAQLVRGVDAGSRTIPGGPKGLNDD